MAIDFKDRAEAGRQLARSLIQYSRRESVILVPMNGSLVIGKVVSNILGIPLDLLMVSHVHHPEQWDAVLGAVSPAGFRPAGSAMIIGPCRANVT